MSFLVTRSVFFRSIATVIGPTPPGTGVIKAAFFFTSKRKEKKALTKCLQTLLPFCSPRRHGGLWLAGTAGKGQAKAAAFLQPWQGWNTARTRAARLFSPNPSPRASSGPAFHSLLQLICLQHAALSPQQHRHSHRCKVNPKKFLWEGAVFAHRTCVTSCSRNIWVTWGRMSPGEQHGWASPPSASWDTAPAISRRATEAGDAIL